MYYICRMVTKRHKEAIMMFGFYVENFRSLAFKDDLNRIV